MSLAPLFLELKRMMSRLCQGLFGLVIMMAIGEIAWAADSVVSTPLTRAHAHNDYLHNRPLLDALDEGFSSVEADIYLVDGELLVAHDRKDCDPARTLRRLYLDPLHDRARRNGGHIHPGAENFILLIDIKSEAEPTYRALNQQLAEYPEVFSSVTDGQVAAKAVQAIVSGNRPQQLIAADSPRFVGIDGRLTDLDSGLHSHLLPLISDNWQLHFHWRGEGSIPPAELQKLNDIVATTHAKQRKLRFWATPDNPAVWKVLNDADVDLINTDNLSGLRKFLTQASLQ